MTFRQQDKPLTVSTAIELSNRSQSHGLIVVAAAG